MLYTRVEDVVVVDGRVVVLVELGFVVFVVVPPYDVELEVLGFVHDVEYELERVDVDGVVVVLGELVEYDELRDELYEEELRDDDEELLELDELPLASTSVESDRSAINMRASIERSFINKKVIELVTITFC